MELTLGALFSVCGHSQSPVLEQPLLVPVAVREPAAAVARLDAPHVAAVVAAEPAGGPEGQQQRQNVAWNYHHM